MNGMPDDGGHFVYLCPLCLKQAVKFGRTVGLQWTTEFSFDHFPTESVGGKHTALVCKPCNAGAGGEFDFALKSKMQRLSFDNRVKGSRIPIKTSINNIPGNYSSCIFVNDDQILEVDLERNEKSAPFIDDWIKNPNDDWEAKIMVYNPDDGKVTKALIKAAYLYCFANWGYEFVFSITGEMMRKCLSGELAYPIRTPFFWLGKSIRESGMSHFPIGLCYLRKPSTVKVFAVNIRLENIATGYAELATVLVPGPTTWDLLKDLGEHMDAMTEKSLDLSFAHVMEYLVTDGVYDGYSKSWGKLQTFK
jgi:hypothetical protein